MLGSVHAVTEDGSLITASMGGGQLGPYVSGAGRVILVVGTARHDGDVDPREVGLLTHSLKSFEVDSEPGAGHYLQEERPAAVVAAALRLAQKAR